MPFATHRIVVLDRDGNIVERRHALTEAAIADSIRLLRPRLPFGGMAVRQSFDTTRFKWTTEETVQ